MVDEKIQLQIKTTSIFLLPTNMKIISTENILNSPDPVSPQFPEILDWFDKFNNFHASTREIYRNFWTRYIYTVLDDFRLCLSGVQ